MMNFKGFYLLNVIALLTMQSSLCRVHDLPIFFKTFFNDPSSVGALFPFSQSVGIEITKYLARYIQENPQSSVRVLEVGAGTGSMTQAIVEHLRRQDNVQAGDHLDAIEISPEFCQVLHQRFDTNPCVSIKSLSIVDWKPEYQYDFIICTLPFNSLDADLAVAIIDHLKNLIKPNGVLSYVAYSGVSSIKQAVLWGKRKEDHYRKVKALEELNKQYLLEKITILMNCPPTNIYHCRIIK